MRQDPATIKGPFVAVLDDEQFGPAETLIGNAIVWHQPTKWSRFTAAVYRFRTRGTGGPLKCRECGVVVGAGWGFWYHQAQAAIELLRTCLPESSWNQGEQQ